MSQPTMPQWVEEPPIVAVNRRLDELGRLVETQAKQIRWLEAEVARVGANVQGLADDTQRERVYRQTGRLPEGRRHEP